VTGFSGSDATAKAGAISLTNNEQFQSGENGEGAEDREEKFTSLRGSDATARAVAKATGVSEKTVRNAGKFAEAVEALQEVSPQAAERVLSGNFATWTKC